MYAHCLAALNQRIREGGDLRSLGCDAKKEVFTYHRSVEMSMLSRSFKKYVAYTGDMVKLQTKPFLSMAECLVAICSR